MKPLQNPEALAEALEKSGYIADRQTVITLYLALKLQKPLLVEGPPGVGKTEIAKVLAEIFDTELIRLQCYEGLDENKALYEWNYQKQLIKIQVAQREQAKEKGAGELEDNLFSEEYLLERPLLRALRADRQPVLLIDEIDKVDQEFEAFLFEVLSDFQVSVPEWGTLKAKQIPIVILTSNGERELSDGLKRRCIYLYLNYPGPEKELRIIEARIPAVNRKLALQVSQGINLIREKVELQKVPSIAETLDWVRALTALEAEELSPEMVDLTLNVILKNHEDLRAFRQNLGVEGITGYLREPDKNP